MSLIAKGFGVTAAGFVLPRLQDIVDDLTQSYQAQFGQSIDTSSDGFFGQKIGTQAKALADLWELAQGIYNGNYPATATGAALSNAVQLTGITRLPATQSMAIVAFFGTNSTAISQGTMVASAIDGQTFQTVDTSDSLGTSSTAVYFEIAACNPGDTVNVTINGTTPGTAHTVVASGATAMATELTTFLAAAFTDLSFDVITGRSGNDDTVVVRSGSGAAIAVSTPAIGGTSPATIINIGTELQVQALNYGAIAEAEGSLSVIVNPISGLDSVFNFSEAVTGRAVETDAALLLRQQQSLAVSGGGNADAIRARIINDVSGVTTALVVENDTNTDYSGSGGLPPNSMMAVVSGGDPQAIADAIWAGKAAGITSYSGAGYNSSTAPFGTSDSVNHFLETVIDAAGNTHTIGFVRPTAVPIYVVVTVHDIDDGKEAAPPSATVQGLITAAVLAYGATLTPGDYVVAGRFFGAIYAACSGLGALSVFIGTSSGPTASATLVISQQNCATFDASRVSVSVTA